MEEKEMIMYDKWEKVSTIESLRSESLTLDEFLKKVYEKIPKDTAHEDILLDFDIDAYEEYDDWGGTQLGVTAEMNILFRKKAK